MSPVLMELKRLFLELSPEDNRRYRASELVQHCSEGDAAACIPLVLDRLVNFPSTHGLGIHVLSELLRLHPMAVGRQFRAGVGQAPAPTDAACQGAIPATGTRFNAPRLALSDLARRALCSAGPAALG